MEHPENVTGEEDDLVCGWTFAKMALDDQEIKDLTWKVYGQSWSETIGGLN